MIIRARNLSPSKFKSLYSLSLFFTEPFTSTTTAKTSLSLSPTKPQIYNRLPHLLFCANDFSFRSKASPSPRKGCKKHQQKTEPSSSKYLTLNRDGNYDDATPHNVVCPGCGVHMQDSDPKHPGFFIKPPTKTKEPMLKTGSGYLVPVSTEPEFTVFLKKGLLFEEKGESPDLEEENLDKEMPESLWFVLDATN